MKDDKALGLSEQQEKFCEEYIKDFNGTKAAKRAGYSEKAAHVQATRLLKNDKVIAKIKQLSAESKDRAKVDADTILKELLTMAMVDITKAYNEDGTLKPLSEIPEDVRRMIAHLEVNEIYDDKIKIGEAKKIKFWSKEKSLELLGKHLKLFTDKMEVEGKVTLEDLVAGSFDEDEK